MEREKAMNNRANLQHKTKEIILFFLVVILLSSLLILLFPAGLAIAGAGLREPEVSSRIMRDKTRQTASCSPEENHQRSIAVLCLMRSSFLATSHT
jgi:hypothetical protein